MVFTRICDRKAVTCLSLAPHLQDWPSEAAQALARGLSPQTCYLAPIVKHTGQESGGELCEIFKFSSFLQSKSVNNVRGRKHASASGGLPPDSLDPTGGLLSPDPRGYSCAATVAPPPLAPNCKCQYRPCVT